VRGWGSREHRHLQAYVVVISYEVIGLTAFLEDEVVFVLYMAPVW
jgi:hypothetical protein